MKYPLFSIAWRQLRSRRSPIILMVSLLTLCGIAFGVASLIIALSIINGFEEKYQQAVLSMNAHLVVMSDTTATEMPDLREKLDRIAGEGVIKEAVPFGYREGLMIHGGRVRGMALKVVPLSHYWNVTGLKHYPSPHQSEPKGIWLGKVLWQELGGETLQKVKLRLAAVDPQAKANYMTVPVAGFFETDLYDYDASFSLIDVKQTALFFPEQLGTSGFEMWLHNADQAPEVSGKLNSQLEPQHTVYAWQELNAHFLGALKLERLLFMIIIGALIMVASCNILGTLTMRLLQRRGDIAILRAIGFNWQDLRQIFVWQGLWLGWAGVFVGILLSSGVIFWLQQGEAISLAAEIYFVDQVPVQVNFIYGVIAWGVTSLFSWLAARLALIRLQSLSVAQALVEV